MNPAERAYREGNPNIDHMPRTQAREWIDALKAEWQAEARREALREAREAVAALPEARIVGMFESGDPASQLIRKGDALAAIDALMGGSPK